MRSPPRRGVHLSGRVERRSRLQAERVAVGQRPAATRHPIRSASRRQRRSRARSACSRSRQRADRGARPGELRLAHRRVRSSTSASMRATPSAGSGGNPSSAIQRRSTRARRAGGRARSAVARRARADRRCAAGPRREASSASSSAAASAHRRRSARRRHRHAASVRAAAAARGGAGSCGRSACRRCSGLRSSAGRALARTPAAPRGTSSSGRHSQPRANAARPHRAQTVRPGARAARAAGRSRPGRRDGGRARVPRRSASSGANAAWRAWRAAASRPSPLSRGRRRRGRCAAARRSARAGARNARPGIGLGVQAMVHVQRAQAARARRRHRRVRAAARIESRPPLSATTQRGLPRGRAKQDGQRGVAMHVRHARRGSQAAVARSVTRLRTRRSCAGACSDGPAGRRPARAASASSSFISTAFRRVAIWRRVAMRAADGFAHDLVDQAVFLQALGGHAQLFGGVLGLLGGLPQDRGAAFRRDHRVGAVFEHQRAVADADRQRAAGTAFADHRADDRHLAVRTSPAGCGRWLRTGRVPRRRCPATRRRCR